MQKNIYLFKKTDNLFSPLQSDDLFQLSSRHNSHLPTSFVHCVLFFLNFATNFLKFHSGVTPRKVSAGAAPLVTPLIGYLQ